MHARFAPSAAHRWVRCPGSVSMCEKRPERADADDLAAREGTAAHWCFERIFAGGTPVVGEAAPNGIAITDEMIAAAAMFVETVRKHEARLLPTADRAVEKTIPIRWIHATDCFGTPDYAAFCRGSGKIVVADLKFGYRVVDAFENWPLAAYAAGVLAEAGISPDTIRENITIDFLIVQPRAYHYTGPVRHWQCPGTKLIEMVEAMRLAATEVSAHPATSRTVPGSHCSHCSARWSCEALRRAGFAVMDEVCHSTPQDLDDTELSIERRMLERASELLAARLSGVEGELMHRIKSGRNVPGLSVEQGYGREKWAKPIAEILALGQMFGVDLVKPDAVTPKQAIKAGVPADVVKMYSETPVGAMKLVESDVRLLQIFQPRSN